MPACAPPIATDPGGICWRGVERRGIANALATQPNKGIRGESDAADLVFGGAVKSNDLSSASPACAATCSRSEQTLDHNRLELDKTLTRLWATPPRDGQRLGGFFPRATA